MPPKDLLLVTRNEGQVWIGLYNLMCEPDCQKRYHFNSHRKDAVLRVRKYLNEVLVDQIPVLQHVQVRPSRRAPPQVGGSHYSPRPLLADARGAEVYG